MFLLNKINKIALSSNDDKRMQSVDSKENIKEHDPNWSQIPDHLYIMLIIGGSGS